MKRILLPLVSALLVTPTVLLAAPGKADPVSPAYVDWQGFTPKSHIWGRELTPSDMRHKITFLLVVEANEKFHNTVLALDNLWNLAPTIVGEAVDWLEEKWPRSTMVVISHVGSPKDHDKLKEQLKPTEKEKKADNPNATLALGNARQRTSCYDNITFPGMPDTTGKLPYLIVMGPEGKEPIYHGPADAEDIKKKIGMATAKGRKMMQEMSASWEPFYGTLPEDSKIRAKVAAAIAKGKPLAQLEKALLKDITSKDETTSAEAQVAYDALQQTRSDMIAKIMAEATSCPHIARLEMDQLFKYWPSEKKKCESVMGKLKAMPQANDLYKMLSKIQNWANPDFVPKNAGEAKKIVQELNKMKKTLEKLKESEVVIVQNGALLLDAKVDELISTIPSAVPAK